MEIERKYSDYGENSTKENLIKILETIAPYVIVTGSYAYGTQTSISDIDMYIIDMPEEFVDCEALHVEDTWTRPLIRFFEELGYEWDSCFASSFSVDDTFIPLEFSAYYSIEEETFPLEILGVQMMGAKSNHTSDKYLNGQKRKMTLGGY